MTQELTPGTPSPFESIRRVNATGNESWSSREFAKALGYVNYRHFEAVIAKAKTACVNSGQREEDHFVGSDQMVEISRPSMKKRSVGVSPASSIASKDAAKMATLQSTFPSLSPS